MTIGPDDYINLGQFKVVDVQVSIEARNTDRPGQNGVPIVLLTKERGTPGSTIGAICSGDCRPGRTTYSDYGGEGVSQPINPLSLFAGTDPVGKWELGLSSASLLEITQWSLSLVLEDRNGNRRLLRGGKGSTTGDVENLTSLKAKSQA